MKQILLLFITPFFVHAQSILLEPSANTNSQVLRIKKDGIGLDHRSPNLLVGVGTYAAGSTGFIQTHTNHPLAFSTNNGQGQVYLLTNGNFGIGTQNPAYLLDVRGRARIQHFGNTAGIWFSKTTNAANEGAFFGNLNDNQTGIWIGNQWRLSLSETGVFNLPVLAGSGVRNVAADANGNLVIGDQAKTSFSVGIDNNVSVNNSNERAVLLRTEEYDFQNNVFQDTYGADYFTVNETGPYQCTYYVIWEGNAEGSRKVLIRDENQTLIRYFEDYPGHAQPFIQHGTANLLLTAGKSYRLYLSQNSSVGLLVYQPFFQPLIWSCHKI